MIKKYLVNSIKKAFLKKIKPLSINVKRHVKIKLQNGLPNVKRSLEENSKYYLII